MRGRLPLALLSLLGLLVATPLAAAPADEAAEPEPAREAVVLLHGLYRSERAMRPLAERLAREGFEVHNVGYPSTEAPPDELEARISAQIEACCAAAPRLHFVTHSLGGILLRGLLAQHEPANLGRVVMLAPPNHGSEWVDWLGNSFGFALGPTGRELGTAPDSLPNRLPKADYPLGVIAGTRSWNPLGAWLIPGANDGTVRVESTRLDGMSDFVELPSSHSWILRSDAAADAVVEFLRAGHFGASGS